MDVWLHVERNLSRYSATLTSNVKDLKVELYLQFGYGMMEHCRFLVRQWGQGTVILSPRDLSSEQLQRLGKDVRGLGGNVLIDPQVYSPGDTNHDRLIAQSFWPESGGCPTGAELHRCIEELIDLNIKAGARKLILPGLVAKRVDDDWLAFQQEVIEEMQRCDLRGMSPMLTIALSHDALRNDEQIQTLLDAMRKWDVPAIYLVCEHPNGDYLVTDVGWLANCADVIAGTRILGKEVVVGYCNHQMLIFACTGATAIASGTWMNVRSFNENKFKLQDDEEIKQRATWYYAPHLLSEYKISFLDLARKTGNLDMLRTPNDFGSSHAEELFTAPQPSLAGFTEQQAFRHYLHCIRYQAGHSIIGSFDETIDLHARQLDIAEVHLNSLHAAGIRGQKRDFLECIDVNRGALAYIKQTRGPVLRRKWSSLI